jgi:hypothetical protein
VGTILRGTLAIGIIDILWAIAMNLIEGRNGLRVLQTIAGGMLGSSTYEGGGGTMLLGLAIHFFIAFCVMTVYYLASRRFSPLRERWWLYGPLYGIVVYLVMYQLVLPLSAWQTRGVLVGPQLYKALFIHIFGVGLVAALIARRPRSGWQPDPT